MHRPDIEIPNQVLWGWVDELSQKSSIRKDEFINPSTTALYEYGYNCCIDDLISKLTDYEGFHEQEMRKRGGDD